MKRWKKILVVAICAYALFAIANLAIAARDVHLKGAKPTVTPAQVKEGPKVEGISVYDLWIMTNEQRNTEGLTALALDPQLEKSALAKCKDMASRDYWSHNTPEGNEPWIFFTKVSEHFGENQAYGYFSAKGTVDGWMASEKHKRNILDPKWNFVGFGVCKSDMFQGADDQTIVVQHFAQ